MVEIERGTADRPGVASLEAADAPLVARLFARLSEESIYRRFFSPLTRSNLFVASLRRLDQRDSAAVAAVMDGEVIGVAQYARKSGAREADLAIVVADDWQRQGLGTRLVAALADHARSVGIESFAVDIQGDNFGALKLFNRVAPGARLGFSAGVGEGSISLT